MTPIIKNRHELIELFEAMETDDILKDMLEARKNKFARDVTAGDHSWFIRRFKVALLELIKREVK